MSASERPEREAENVNINGESYTGGTDRESGEYHYKSGYTQRIYADAHYVPANENTVPPRYYTPPERSAKVSSEPKKAGKKQTGMGIRIFSVCLACLLLGAVSGAAFVGKRMEERVSAIEERLAMAESGLISANELGEKALVKAGSRNILSTIFNAGRSTSPAAIYELACRQVVGITTEVTYTNFFGRSSSSALTGSGFIVSEDGYILTNYHVIEYAFEYGYAITVMLHDGTRYPATIVGAEEGNDIAVLKIDAVGLTPVTFGDSNSLSVGDEVYAVGNPLGELEFSMTFGRVSALDRLISADDGEEINMFQFDAAVNSGNSGGPAYNDGGEVVGIVTAKYASSGVEGLGFAIPINDATDIAEDLITKGYVTGKAYLGVQLDQRFTSVYSHYYGLPNGAYVSYVEKGSCAEKSTLQPGDIITAVGEYPIKSYTDVNSALRHFSAGDESTVEIYRSGETRLLPIVFDEAKPSESSNNALRIAG